jgi:ATP-binding cassette subfamily B protein
VNQAFSLVQPYLLMIGIDRYVAARDTDGLGRLAIIFLVAVVGEFCSYYGQSYLTMLVAQRSLADLRVGVFKHLQRLPMSFFDRTPVGKLVSRVTTDVDVLNEMFAAGAMTIVLDLLKLVGITAFMCWINWQMALVSLVLLFPMTIAIDFFRRRARVTYRQIRERIARINGFLQEAITGMTVVQLSAREARAIEFYELLSSFDFMSSTPTLFNAGTLRSQLSSCYLTTVPDDLDGIVEFPRSVAGVRMALLFREMSQDYLLRPSPPYHQQVAKTVNYLPH